MNQQTLHIDPEFKAQIPPLTEDERKQLEENILADGEILSPLLVWNDTIVDGHNRYEILQSHPEIPCTYRSDVPVYRGISERKRGIRSYRIHAG